MSAELAEAFDLLLEAPARSEELCRVAEASDQRLCLRFRRMAFKALHNLCSGAYWANPAVYAATGYPGPPANLQAPALVEPDPAAVPADPAPSNPPTSGTL